MNIMDYIRPEFAAVIVMLVALGMLIKHTEIIKNKYIPLILGIVGITICTCYLIGQGVRDEYIDWINVLPSGFMQGILCAAVSVYGHQFIKQLGEKTKDEGSDDE